MKVLQVNCVYNEGSTGKIVYDLHQSYLKKGLNSVVCYGRGKQKNEVSNVIKICGELYSKCNQFCARFTGVMYGGCFLSTQKLIKVIKKEQPNIVHLHCLNGYFVNIYSLLKWLGKQKINTVLTLHAEFMYTGGCGYSNECNKWMELEGCNNCPIWKTETKSVFRDRTNVMWRNMKKAFSYFDNSNLRIVSVSEWLEQRAASSVLLKERKHCVVLNGIDTQDKFYQRECVELKKRLGLSDEKIILHVTASFSEDMDHPKGGYYVLKLAERMKNENVKFVIVGDRNSDSRKLPDNVINVGRVESSQQLAQYYSMADMTLLTSKRETYSMVCAESLCCGTPVVGFKAGAPETISLAEYSVFVEFGNLEKLEKVVKESLKQKKASDISKNAISKYKKDNMVDAYCKIYDELIYRNNSDVDQT